LFFSVLRLLKIVKPTRHPGKKKNPNKQAFKNEITFACCMNVKHEHKFDVFHIYQQKKYSTECKIEKNG
jgi:hypothetical protein